jgi:hypothetical protein
MTSPARQARTTAGVQQMTRTAHSSQAGPDEGVSYNSGTPYR